LPICTHHRPLSYLNTPQTTLLSAHTTDHSPIRTHHRPLSYPHTPQTTLLSAHTADHSPICTHHRPLSYPHTPQTNRLSAHTADHSPIRTHPRPLSYPHTPETTRLSAHTTDHSPIRTHLSRTLSHKSTHDSRILIHKTLASLSLPCMTLACFCLWLITQSPLSKHTHTKGKTHEWERALVSPRKRAQMIGLVQEQLGQHHVLGALWVESLLLPQRLYARCVAVSAPPSYRSRQTKRVSGWWRVSECKSK